MPMRSMGSGVSPSRRRPAVSVSTRGTPRTFATSSRVSRVVPGIGVTMARSVRRRALSRLDLPTLGLPTRAVRTPWRSTMPVVALAISAWMSPRAGRRSGDTSAGGTSSSGKSIVASRWASACSKRALTPFTRADSPPPSCSTAMRSPSPVRACTTSSTASAWARSSRPLRNARRVNSPGWASRAPSCRQSDNTLCSGTVPPWQSISTTSSRVYECGARIRAASTSSTRSPVWGSRKYPNTRRCDSHSPGAPGRSEAGTNMRERIGSACGPLRRMVPIPPSPGGVAMATMVSSYMRKCFRSKGKYLVSGDLGISSRPPRRAC